MTAIICLADAVITADALHTVRDHAAWLVETKNADYIMIVKGNSWHLHQQLKRLPWRDVPLADKDPRPRARPRRSPPCTPDQALQLLVSPDENASALPGR